MHEEQVPMSDEEVSDSEIILVDRSPSPANEPFSSGGHNSMDRQAKFVTEEMKIDEQLKDLGLFEEGMSIEQKEELLTVLQVSRETAQQEETQRKKAKEWEKSVYFSHGNKIEFHPCEQSPESISHDVELCCLNSADHSGTSAPTDKTQRGNLLSDKSCETLVTRSSRKSYEVLDIEDPETGESQAVTHQNPTTFSTGIFYSRTSETRLGGYSELESMKTDRNQRGVHRLSRSAYHPSSSSTSRVAVAHPIVRESMISGSSASCEEEDMMEENGDACKTKHELERNMTFWRPCISPVSPAMQCERTNLKSSVEFRNVPYFCVKNVNPKEHSKVILKSLNRYHEYLRKVQGALSNFIPWGKPVRVGRHLIDTLDVQESQYEARSIRVPRTRSTTETMKHGESDVFAEEENEDCNDSDNAIQPNVNRGSDVECNTIVRTVKSAFRPINSSLRDPLGEAHTSRKSVLLDHHQTQSNDLDNEPCAMKLDDETVKTVTGRNRRMRMRMKKGMSEINREEDCEDNSSRLALWSPFGPSGEVSNDKGSNDKNSVTYLNTFGNSDKNNRKVSSSELTLSSTLPPAKMKSDVCIVEDKISDPELCVRKDGQRTYASKQSQNSLSLSSECFDSVRACSSQESSGSKRKVVEQLVLSRSSDDTVLEDRTLNIDEIEQRGISRKRKCEVRLRKLSPSEIENFCSGKRWKE